MPAQSNSVCFQGGLDSEILLPVALFFHLNYSLHNGHIYEQNYSVWSSLIDLYLIFIFMIQTEGCPKIRQLDKEIHSDCCGIIK